MSPAVDFHDPTFWEREPAIVIGLVTAVLGFAASLGLHVSNETVGAIGGAITAVFALAASFFIRTKVTSPATAAEGSRAKAALAGQLSSAQIQAQSATVRATQAEGMLAQVGQPADGGYNPGSALHPMAVLPELPATEGNPA